MAVIKKKRELMDKLIREEIVTTVLGLISGNRPVTMDDIALECGVSKGTLYNYFKDKKALIDYVHQTIIMPIKDNNQAIFESEKTPRDKLYHFVDEAFRFQETYPLYFKFVQSQRTEYESSRERFEIVIQPLAKLCKEGGQKGVFVDLDPYVMASMIFGTVIGPMQTLDDREEGIHDMEKLKQDVICLLDRMMLKQEK